MPVRRELTVAVALGALGGVLALVAAGRGWAWVRLSPPPPLPVHTVSLAGHTLAPLIPALALASLAGLAGILATRAAVRAAVGVLLVAFGAGMLIAAAQGTRASAITAAAIEHAGTAGAADTARLLSTAWWPAIAAAGGALVVVTGLLTLVRGRRWPAMSSRYDRPGGRDRPAGPPVQQDMWAAMDSGEDPTLGPGEPPSGRSGETPQAQRKEL